VPPRSARLDAIEALGGAAPPAEVASTWNATEWNLYLETIARPAAHGLLDTLEARFHLTQSNNYDVLVAWLALCLQSGYHAVLSRVDQVLAGVGRMKYLRPLYTALAKHPGTRDRARASYERLRAGYHPIARQMVESVLREHA
jgi:hypothetical protein